MQPKYKVSPKQQAEEQQDKVETTNDKQSSSFNDAYHSSTINKVNLSKSTTNNLSAHCPSTSPYFNIENLMQALSDYLFGKEEEEEEKEEKVIHAAKQTNK